MLDWNRRIARLRPLHGRTVRLHGPEEGDDTALARRMRAAAVAVHVDGRSRLELPARNAAAVRRLNRRAEALYAGCLEGGAALESLMQAGRMMEACAAQAALDRVGDLPAEGGKARILAAAEAMLGSGGVPLTIDRIMLAIASFDEVQALEMAELWSVPEALRICISCAYVEAAQECVRIAADRGKAERWAAGEEVRLNDASPAFYEHALQIVQEQDDHGRREMLEAHLLKSGRSSDEVVQRAHRDASVARMRIENLLAGKRLLDGSDWGKCFGQLSAVEGELRYDPSGVYVAMEDDSRAVVRREIAVLARRLKVSELTVARYAVSAAQAARYAGKPERMCTVCFWLCDDSGRAELAGRMGVERVRLPRLVRDPEGVKSAWAVIVLAMTLYLVFMAAVRSVWLIFPGVPVAWCAATELLGSIYPRFVKPSKLLKLKINRVPDSMRTLLVMPVLLSSVSHAEEICDRMEALYSLETDRNIRALILGDFADADAEHLPQDDEIVEYMRIRIRRMNARAGEERFYYLHRNRRLLEADGRWMGRDRKRGALMDLNRLLLGRHGAEAAFDAEGGACELLKNGYAYVLTIDADTRFLPGDIQRMIGTIAHPLNVPGREGDVRRGYAIIAPQMEMTAGACVNRFVSLFAGQGGLNTYPTSVSSFWQDFTGTGVFGGKGIYAVRPFMEALEGALPEGRILSHDMIEGALAGAALASDICFYDGFPATLNGFMKRFHRWTRGDWQLLPRLFSVREESAGGNGLDMADRVRMLDNLIRSLQAPALLGVLTTAIWLGNRPALIAGMLFAFAVPVLRFPKAEGRLWLRALAELAILPVTAAYAGDAVLRTLWRLAFTGRHLLDWVTAADAERTDGRLALPCRMAAILLLPGLLVPGWIVPTLALTILFAAAPEWLRSMEQTPLDPAQTPNEVEAEVLLELAEDIWGFFERYVDAQNHFLPPDNVQVDPAPGVARRTSPTNIGLYLMSCAAARRLRLIDREQMLERIRQTLDTLERMDKWRGHLYNWHATDTLKPLSPGYVSSVDSGNLAAALMMCASEVETEDENLAERLRVLVKDMDFVALYDRDRELFFIGMDVEHDRLSGAHYDLLASESRILSYAAMMLGQIPVRHWTKLSRALTAIGNRSVLLSWSGTMFEYLMPELLMHSPGNTLLGETVDAVIRAQRARGRERGRPWGVSESGYCAFDLHLNYQYRAFGLRSLSMGGNAPEDVAAPYASLLAAPMQPGAVVRNIERMQACGWRGGNGFYEAADYLHTDGSGSPRVVRSYMSHHQGMALCALCNALTDRSLVRSFMKIPETSALSMLLEEKRAAGVCLEKPVYETGAQMRGSAVRRDSRQAKSDLRVVEAHLLSGAGTTVLVTADGAVHYERNGVQATRYGGDLLNRNDGACVHLRRERTGETCIPGNGHVRYMPGKAFFAGKLGPLEYGLTLSVSPEDGALLKRIVLRNDSEADEAVRIADCAPVSLGKPGDMRAHAVFRNLFVESERLAVGAVGFRRRRRESGEHSPRLVHLVSAPGDVHCETDLEKLVGRMGSTSEPGGIRWSMGDGVGTVLNPCTAIEIALVVPAGQQIELHFALGLTEEENIEKWLEHNFSESVCRRTEQLAAMQAASMLGFLGLEPSQHQLLQRASALLFDARLAAGTVNHRSGALPVSRETLWSMGISGELPIMAVYVNSKDEIGRVREAVRIHDFYRTMGVKVDLALINEHGNDYEQPVRDAISDAVAFSHLNDRRGSPGGVHILEGRLLTQTQREAIKRCAVLLMDGGRDLYAQIRGALSALNCPSSLPAGAEMGKDILLQMHSPPENGYGARLADNRYAIDVSPEKATPAPWCNLMANDGFGVLLSERCGGFLWAGNSRSGRLTRFYNDVLDEGWGWMFYLADEETDSFIRLLPGKKPMMSFRTVYAPEETVYRFETETISGEIAFCVRSDAPELRVHMTIRSAKAGSRRLVGFVDWLMGADAADACMLRTWTRDGACFAAGAAPGVGYFATDNARARPGIPRTAFLGRGGIMHPEGIMGGAASSEGWVLNIPVQIREDRPLRAEWVIGWAEDARQAVARVRAFYAQAAYEPVRTAAREEWQNRLERMKIETPDGNLNALANGWLLHQSLTGRIRARTGLYQPGGAYGFRDQLQDMLALLPFDPNRVREHILRCAAHQFEDGDVMHWWHEPFQGVRTRISDDLLFLPYVTARYVRWTGDEGILSERIPYLKNAEIEADREDCHGIMQPGEVCETLHNHCMRAFRRASAVGEHGLCRMGGGDWNDGMNLVGRRGRGESVWLTQFLAVCAREYAVCAPSGEDKVWLTALSDRMCAAVEEHGWDGEWYLRAYTDDGIRLGSAGGAVCRIDAISQAWAVLAQLDEARCAQAMDAVWRILADENTGIIRLLTPPFGDDAVDPGYIRGYPAGVRENGAQYTHAACWVLLALIRMGDPERAHRALQMLIPANHGDTKEKAEVYRVEPYVMAADVYDGEHAGRGGWTWYTGSAAWMYLCILELLGFDRRGNRVRLHALLGDWPEASAVVTFGKAKYRLVCRKGVEAVTLDGAAVQGDWIEMQDDGAVHEAVFPPRRQEPTQMIAEERMRAPAHG